MSEIKDPTAVVTPAATVKAKTPEEVKETATAAALAKLPSVEDLQKQIEEIEAKKLELAKLQDLKQNYGPGKKGKKQFSLQPLPQGLGRISVNGEVFEGIKELDHEQWTNYVALRDARLEAEEKLRYGEGVTDRQLRAMGSGGGVHIARTGESAKF